MNKEKLRAWLLAIFSITILWSFSNLSLGVASKVLNANSVIYTCCLFIGSAFSILLYAGKGDLGKEAIRSADTWGYGIVLILGFLLSFYIFGHTTATGGSLLQRSSIIASALASWLFFNRKITIKQAIGLCLIFVGVCIVASGVMPENKGVIYSLVIIFSFLQAGRIFLAELHRTYKYASENRNEKDQIRVIGYIMFVVALMFLGLSLLFSYIQYSTGTHVSSLVPELKEFTNPYSIFTGLIVGMVLLAPIRVIEFIAASKIKSENYLALASIAPFSILFWEWATQDITGLSLKHFSQSDFIAAILIFTGGVLAALSKAKKQISNDLEEFISVSYDIQAIEDSKDIIEKAFSHFNKDLLKTSQELALPKEVVRSVLESEDVALKKDILKMIERKYRAEIAIKDSLTGLLNRDGLMLKLRDLIDRKKDFFVFYIDLNKFKPINDNYGHHAGDEALQVVAGRLLNFHRNCKIVSRLGGDEYVIVLEKPHKENVEELVKNLNSEIENYFTLKTVNMVVGISASIGYVKASDYVSYDAGQLLDMADSLMLEMKKLRTER